MRILIEESLTFLSEVGQTEDAVECENGHAPDVASPSAIVNQTVSSIRRQTFALISL